MNGQTVIIGILFLILPFLVGFFIYSRPKEPEEPGEPGEPSIKLLESSAILNPGGIQSVIEGYTIEYSSGTYTDDELSKFVNIKIKWNNLGGFSRVKRLKLTLMNGETVIEPSKEFIRSSSVDSEYFENFSTAPLEYIFVGEDVSAGNFIGTIKPVFEYSVEITGSDTFKPLLLNNDISISVNTSEITLSLDDGISTELTYTPIISTESNKVPEILKSFDSDGYIFSNGERTLNQQFGDKKLYIITAGTVNKSEIHLRTDDNWVAVDGVGNLSLVNNQSQAYTFKISNDPSIVTDYYYIILQSTDESKLLVFKMSGYGNDGGYMLTDINSMTTDHYDSMILSYRQRYVKNGGDEVIVKFVDDSEDYFLSINSPGISGNPNNAKVKISKATDMEYVSPHRIGSEDPDGAAEDFAARAQKSHTSENAGWFILQALHNLSSIKFVRGVFYKLKDKSGGPYVMPIVRWGETNSYFFREDDGFVDYAVKFNNYSDPSPINYNSTTFPPVSQKHVRFQFFSPLDIEYKYPLELKF